MPYPTKLEFVIKIPEIENPSVVEIRLLYSRVRFSTVAPSERVTK